MAKYITEILDEVNKDPAKISLYKDNFAIKTILQYSYNPELKFKLPPGTPPYKPDAAPIGMSPANFYQQVKKLYVFMREDISNVRRESLFIQLIEGLHPTEANVLCAVKDQNLASLYPNITRALAESVGFVEPLTAEEQAAEDSKSKAEKAKGKSLVLNLSDTTVAKESFGKPKDKAVKGGEPAKEPVLPGQEAPVKRGRGRPRKNPV